MAYMGDVEYQAKIYRQFYQNDDIVWFV